MAITSCFGPNEAQAETWIESGLCAQHNPPTEVTALIGKFSGRARPVGFRCVFMVGVWLGLRPRIPKVYLTGEKNDAISHASQSSTL